MTDIVYVVKRGEHNDELRHSLRSLANLEHAKVWIVGFKPSWVRGVGHIFVRQARSKYRNSTDNLRAACMHPDVSEGFWYFNDDFYVMRPIDHVPALHRGPVADVIADYETRFGSGPYLAGMRQTHDLLRRLGHDNPLSYELHVPMYLHKRRMLDALDKAKRIPAVHKRTLYGNLWFAGGARVDDVKVRSRAEPFDRDSVFLSSSDQAFRGPLGWHLREVFAEPSPYERVLVGGRR